MQKRKQMKWNRKHELIALFAYKTLKQKNQNLNQWPKNPEIKDLFKKNFSSSSNSFSLKLQNIKYIEKGRGYSNYSTLNKEIWEEYRNKNAEEVRQAII